MSYRIELTDAFERQFKKLVKKYPSLKQEIIGLKKDILENPKSGTSIGKDCYKIRIAINSKGKGKSGGGRVITHLYVQDKVVFLLAIYDKAKKETIEAKELESLLSKLSLP
jgi:mRNA-degrading endonuclease RelE of RelBE toxin-antitoxin system